MRDLASATLFRIGFNSYQIDRTQVLCTSSSTLDVVKLYSNVPQGSVVGPQQFSAYAEDIEETIASHTPPFTYDTQIQAHVHLQELYACVFKLECCVVAIKDWCSRHHLQLNPDKTELIVYGSKAHFNGFQQEDASLHFKSFIKLLQSVRDLSMKLDLKLSMHYMQHNNGVIMLFSSATAASFDKICRQNNAAAAYVGIEFVSH